MILKRQQSAWEAESERWRAMLRSEENKRLAQRSWELLRNLEILDEVYAANLVWH